MAWYLWLNDLQWNKNKKEKNHFKINIHFERNEEIHVHKASKMDTNKEQVRFNALMWNRLYNCV